MFIQRKIWAEKEGVPLMDKLTEDCLGYKIMMRPTVNKINFEITPEVKKLSKEHVSNYFNNPEKHWGPKRAAAIVMQRETKEERSERERLEEEEENKEAMVQEDPST